MDIGILILRVALGLTMSAHGAQKLFGWFKGPGLEGTSGWLQSLGFRPPKAFAAMSGTSEFAGGLLLATGFLTPLGAAATIGAMIAAIAVVHWSNGFFSSAGGYEFNLLIIAAAAAIAFAGPGSYSVDSALGWALAGSSWGIAAIILGAVSAVSVVASRRQVAPEPQVIEEAHDPAKAA